jgi:hypothetical protein
MRPRFVASSLIVSLCLVQLPVAIGQETAALVLQQTAVATSILVPAGTVIPLTLVDPIKHKTSKPGSSIRARVAFPITIGEQIAIPVGTYVEGTLNPPPPKGKGRNQPSNQPNVSIHFTRLLFANGYAVSLDALNTALVTPLVLDTPSPNEYAALNRPKSYGPSADPEYDPLPRGQFPIVPPTPPAPVNPYAHNGPTAAELAAFTVGPIAAIGLLFLFIHNGGQHGNYLLDDAGWQFQMTLQNPLSLDAANVAAAAAMPPPQ